MNLATERELLELRRQRDRAEECWQVARGTIKHQLQLQSELHHKIETMRKILLDIQVFGLTPELSKAIAKLKLSQPEE